MTDSAVTGDIEDELAEFKKRKWGRVVACAAGAGADTDELKKITDSFALARTRTEVVNLDAVDQYYYQSFFNRG